jgi:hypothetical protein
MKYNHKWGKNNREGTMYHARQTCVKCGVIRQWLGSPWNCWEYSSKNIQTTFKRPNCNKGTV